MLLSVAALLAGEQVVAATPDRPTVAIIDSGVAKTAELSPFLVAEYDLATKPARAPFTPRYDHGTMVATIIAREAKRNFRIISMRIDDPAGCPAGAAPPCQPNPALMAAAIRQAGSLGVDTINISLALGSDPRITAAVRETAAKGIRFVLAAGNDGLARPGNLDSARAGYPNAVLVGALDSAGKPWIGTNRPGRGPRDYNYSWQLGVRVPTTAANGRPVTGTGTSFAAPIETARLLSGGRKS
ncbi:MAG TPA: S8/S53 family peptidase [Sphingomicrobium sp.]